MLRIVVRALRRRRLHALTLFLLGLIAATAAAAAPGYAIASGENLAASELASATPAERIVSVSGDVTPKGDVATTLRQLADTVASAVNLPGFPSVTDARVASQLGDTRIDLTYREGVCDRLTFLGKCPTEPGEVALAADIAGFVKATVGTTLNAKSSFINGDIPLKVVGIYRPTDPIDPYWGPSVQAENGTVTGRRFQLGTAFTALSTFATYRPNQIKATVDFLATPEAVRTKNPQLLAQSYELAEAPLGVRNLEIGSSFRAYADRVLTETNLIYLGVVAATLQLLILVWFALALAIRQTGQTRRPDVALMKLRGSGRYALWSLAAGQAAVPIIAGGLAGLAIGGLGVRYWAGPVDDPTLVALGRIGTVLAAVVAVVIAILAALVAERRMLSEPVADLARRVPSRQRGWRASVIDAAVIALALAAAIELRSGAVATNQFQGLDVLAPTLVALAVGVIAAWVVPRLAMAWATPSLRAGRLGSGLTAVHLARRSALPRVLTMLILAVAVVTGAAVNWDVANRAQYTRALTEVGADRVLTVQATSSAALLAATRAVDPEGRYAMAAVRTLNGKPVLAVDTTRLAAVVPWTDAYGLPDWATVARALRPSDTPAITLHSGLMTLDATWTPAKDAKATQVNAVLELPDGTVKPTTLGVLRSGRASYQAAVAGCDPDCRLVGFSLVSPGGLIGSTLVLRQLSADGTAVVDRDTFVDRVRWRTSVVAGDELPLLASGPDGLAVTVDVVLSQTTPLTYQVFVRDSATPVPMYGAGEQDPEITVGLGQVLVPGSGPVPTAIVGSAARLPRVGAGQLVDLETVSHLRPGGARMEVWLAGDTPPAVVQGLVDHGLTIVDDESIAQRLGQLRDQGPPVALIYLLVVGLVGLALAVGAFAVALAVERGSRAEELAALRRQGLRAKVARTVAYSGYVIFVVVAVVVGVLTAQLATQFIVGRPRVFGDGWAVLPSPAPGLLAVGVIAGAVLVVAGLVALAGGRALVRLVSAEGSSR